jgi:hypothetical protein
VEDDAGEDSCHWSKGDSQGMKGPTAD